MSDDLRMGRGEQQWERARTRTEVFGGIEDPEGWEMKCVKNDVVGAREG